MIKISITFGTSSLSLFAFIIKVNKKNYISQVPLTLGVVKVYGCEQGMNQVWIYIDRDSNLDTTDCRQYYYDIITKCAYTYEKKKWECRTKMVTIRDKRYIYIRILL